MLFRNIKPLVDIPLPAFPSTSDVEIELYDLRCKTTRDQGFFMVRCAAGDEFAARFQLSGDYEGNWMLGRVRKYTSLTSGLDSYQTHLYCGLSNLSAVSFNGSQLLAILKALDDLGTGSISTNIDDWDKTIFDVFTPAGITPKPYDLSLALLFEVHGGIYV